MKLTKLISSVVLFVCSFWALIAAASPSWTLLGPGGLTFPLFRGGSTTVYDPSSNRVILFAGSSDDVGNPRLNDVWVQTNANGLGGTGAWSQLLPSGALPQVRSQHSAVYDAANNRMIIYGGCGADPTSNGCLPIADNGRVLSNANGLGGTGLLGTHCGLTNAVWALSHANGTGGTPVWTNLVPQGAPGAPSNRSATFGIYEPDTNTMTIFGGSARNGAVNDTWVLSHANG